MGKGPQWMYDSGLILTQLLEERFTQHGLSLNVEDSFTELLKKFGSFICPGLVTGLKNEIRCYSNMYNLAKKKKASWAYIYEEILLQGFDAALYGYMYSENQKDKEEFKKECEKFSARAKDIDERLETTLEEREGWEKLQAFFEKFMRWALLDITEFIIAFRRN